MVAAVRWIERDGGDDCEWERRGYSVYVRSERDQREGQKEEGIRQSRMTVAIVDGNVPPEMRPWPRSCESMRQRVSCV